MRSLARFADLPGGVRLPYVEQGDAAGLPVILLHGVTDSHRSFEPLLPHLPPGLRAIAVTQRGHCGASRPESGFGIADLAGDLAAFLDVLGIETAVVVGHSMGSVVAQRFAAEHPGRVRALMLLGSFASLAENAAVHEIMSAIGQLGDPVDEAFVREFQVGTAANPLPPQFLDMVVGESLTLPSRIWRALFAGFLCDDTSHLLERITAPTMIVWGDRETICPRSDQDVLLRRIGVSRLVTMDGIGHSLHWENPAGVAHELMVLLEWARGREAIGSLRSGERVDHA